MSHETRRAAEKGRLVLLLQGVEEGVIPLIEEHIDVDHAKREQHDREQEPQAAHRSSEDQYGRIMAHAWASVRPRLVLTGFSGGVGGVPWGEIRTCLKHLRMVIHSEI